MGGPKRVWWGIKGDGKGALLIVGVMKTLNGA